MARFSPNATLRDSQVDGLPVDLIPFAGDEQTGAGLLMINIINYTITIKDIIFKHGLTASYLLESRSSRANRQ